MTEHELFEYRRLLLDRASILERIAEFEGRRSSPPGVNLSPFPPDRKDGSEGFVNAVEYHTRLLRELDRINGEIEKAASTLFEVKHRFETDALMQSFIEKAYFKGVPYGRIHKILHIGRATVYRMRKTVLAEVEKIK